MTASLLPWSLEGLNVWKSLKIPENHPPSSFLNHKPTTPMVVGICNSQLKGIRFVAEIYKTKTVELLLNELCQQIKECLCCFHIVKGLRNCQQCAGADMTLTMWKQHDNDMSVPTNKCVPPIWFFVTIGFIGVCEGQKCWNQLFACNVSRNFYFIW